MAVNCSVSPAIMDAVLGVTESEVSTAGVTVNLAEPLIVPTEAVREAYP